jgi:hypothetical protein
MEIPGASTLSRLPIQAQWQKVRVSAVEFDLDFAELARACVACDTAGEWIGAFEAGLAFRL